MYRRLLFPPLIALAIIATIFSIPITLQADDTEPTPTSLTAQNTHTQDETEAITIALRYLEANRDAYGLTAADLQDIMIQSSHTSAHSGVTHVYLRQRFNRLEVLRSDAAVHVLPNGRVLTAHAQFFTHVDPAALPTDPRLTPAEALRTTAAHFGFQRPDELTPLDHLSTDENKTVFAPSGLSERPIPVRLVYAPDENGQLQLAWSTILYQLNSDNIWYTLLSATDGRILYTENWTITDLWGDPAHRHAPPPSAETTLFQPPNYQPHSLVLSNSYRVIPFPYESPTDPGATFALVSNPAHATASPFGWHDTDGTAGAEFTTTQGNNVFAYLDRDGSDSPDGPAPDGGSSLVFDYSYDDTQEPHIGTNDEAAVVNLFYWNNIMHDILYQYGFDEAAGNFQVNNYGNGGAANDDVQARAQWDALNGTRNNATFGTPPDGSQPAMRMYLWSTASPEIDGDFDNGIIAHEYGHGWSTRLTGGPSNVSCLFNEEQMGEGWSDFLTLVFTAQPGDTAEMPRPIGTYALDEDPLTGGGIRPAPYTTDMAVNSYTYGDTALGTLSVPHGIGFVWNTMLWEMYWALVDQHGYNPDLYADWTNGGNNLALQLVSDGLALQPCNPGFVDGRDAILAADVALTGGQNQCLIWDAFAKRGLGVSAAQGSSDNLSDNVEAYDLPQTCLELAPIPAQLNVCVNDSAAYTVSAGGSIIPTVNFDVSGHPAGSTAVFNPATLPTTPNTTTLTLSNLSGAAAGLYPLTITATNSTNTYTTTADLQLFTPLTTKPQLLIPADNATGVFLNQIFSWQTDSNAQSYLFELDDDSTFTSPIYTATVNGDSHQPSIYLSGNTLYYWRVTASNICSSDQTSDSYQFTTTDANSFVCNAPAINFDAGIPADWAVSNEIISSPAISWTTTAETASCAIENRTNGSGEAACINRDRFGSTPFDYSAQLVTNPFDLTDITQAQVQLQAYYRHYDSAPVDTFAIDLWDGTQWQNLLLWNSDHLSGEKVTLDLSPYVGQTDLQLRFDYSGNGWGFYAQVDEIALSCGNPETALTPPAVVGSAVSAEHITRTVTVSNSGTGLDLEWNLALNFDQVIDDGVADNALGEDIPFIWLNRFTPTRFPFTLEEIWVQFGSSNVAVGDAVDLLVYEDTDGDNDPGTGAVLLARYPVTVQTTSEGVWSTYPLTEPVTLDTPGDLLVGVVTRYDFGGSDSYPARLDQSDTQRRSWIGDFSSTPPLSPTLPTDGLWGMIDDFGYPGNWMIRGLGSTAACDPAPSWLTIDPTAGAIPPGAAAQLNFLMDTTGLTIGEYTADICLTTNDSDKSELTLPVTLTVVPPNQAPSGSNDFYTTTTNIPFTANILSNDSDPDADPLIVTAYETPTQGTLNIAADGTLAYTPTLNFAGTEQISYTVSDGALTDTAEITIHVIDIPPAVTLDSPDSAPVNTSVMLSLTVSDTTNGPPTAVVWDLGDGTRITDTLTVSHTYTTPGDYTVTVTVTYANGVTIVTTRPLMIRETGGTRIYLPLVISQ